MTQTSDRPTTRVLPDDVCTVLQVTAAIIGERTAKPIDATEVAATTEGIQHLLTALGTSAGLRRLARSRVADLAGATTRRAAAADDSDATDRRLAADLVDDDPRTVERATRSIQAILTDAKRAGRRERRAARNADAPSAERRQHDREQAKLDELRTSRDRANARAEQARADVSALHEQIADLHAELVVAHDQADASAAQASTYRATLTDPVALASLLATALTSQLTPDVPSDPHRSVELPAASLDLAAAAAHAGLPAEVVATASTWLPRLLTWAATPPQPAPARTSERALRVAMLGGIDIGGSAALVTAGSARILIDAGSRIDGYDDQSMGPPDLRRALDRRLDAVVVTHAHNDHAGWVPRVVAAQPQVPVLTSPATADLLATMWFDSAKVLASRARQEQTTPAYTVDDVHAAIARLRPAEFGQTIRFGDLSVELFRAGHIVGAAGVVVQAGEQRAVISGDVSRPGQKSVGGIELPDLAHRPDLLVLESTYAAMSRPMPRAAAVDAFVADVARIVSAGGQVLVPAFALGRAQEIALTLGEHLPDVNIIVDGLARTVSEVYQRHHGPDRQPLRVFTGSVRPVPPGDTRRELTRFGAGVIIATSGMLTAGPAVSWARKLLPDPTAGLLVVGYQDEDSPGARLLALADAGGGMFELPAAGPGSEPEKVPVAAHVARYGLGAHASADELISIAADVDARLVMAVHGDAHARSALEQRLDMRRQPTCSPRTDWHARTPPTG